LLTSVIFFSFCKLNTTSIDAHKCKCLQLTSTGDNPRTQRKHFWKHVSIIKQNKHSIIPLKIGENVISESQFIAETFGDNFRSVSNSSSSVDIPNSSNIGF
jgi:hypothetical protein